MRRLGSSRGSAHFSLSQGPDNSNAPPHRSYYTLPHQGHAWKYICKFMKIFSHIPTGHIQQMCKFPRPRCEISNLTPCLLRIPYYADTAKSVIAGFSFANTQMISFQAASSWYAVVKYVWQLATIFSEQNIEQNCLGESNADTCNILLNRNVTSGGGLGMAVGQSLEGDGLGRGADLGIRPWDCFPWWVDPLHCTAPKLSNQVYPTWKSIGTFQPNQPAG